MSEREQRTAQKGLVLDTEKKRVLVIKYSDSRYQSHKLNGKLALPGGQIDFGEEPDNGFVREVEEETGITCEPGTPFYIWTWIYKKDGVEKQIVAIARLGFYKSGEPHQAPKEENESKIELVGWMEIDGLVVDDFVEDERPIIKAYFEYQKQNPFL